MIQRFYVLRVLESDNRIMVPTDKSGQVGLRRIAGEDEIDEVRQILRDKEVHIDKQTWNRRYRGFMEKIRSGSLFEVAEVFRDLYRLKGMKPLSFGERRMLDTARGLDRPGAFSRARAGRKQDRARAQHAASVAAESRPRAGLTAGGLGPRRDSSPKTKDTRNSAVDPSEVIGCFGRFSPHAGPSG